jgi:hypothetical protein
MTLPPSVRVNVGAPFPARVQGSGPVLVTKANGIWTISLNISGIAQQTPPSAKYPTDFFLIWDSVAQSWFQVPLSFLSTLVAARTQRLVTASPIVIAAGDQVLNCNIAAAATCALPTAASRNGVPLTFKDLGQAGIHPITITPNGAETIDGAANFVMTINRQELTLVPFNDGTNTGWFIG